MAHELEFRNGNANMAYVGETPWHGLGQKFDPGVDLATIMKALGTDRQVRALPVFGPGGEIDGYRAIQRDGHAQPYAIMSDGYRPMQDETIFQPWQEAVASGVLEFETAGTLHDGAKVWLQLRPKTVDVSADVVPGDEVTMRLLAANSHNGTLAATLAATATRVVCQNTLSAALGKNDSAIRLKHTKNGEVRFLALAEGIAAAHQSFLTNVQAWRAMAKTPMNDGQFRSYAAQVFGVSEEPNPMAKRKRQEDDSRSVLTKLQPYWEAGRGSQYARGTVWGAYNAMTEFLTWERGRSVDARLDSLWFGQGAKLSAYAAQLAASAAGVTS